MVAPPRGETISPVLWPVGPDEDPVWKTLRVRGQKVRVQSAFKPEGCSNSTVYCWMLTGWVVMMLRPQRNSKRFANNHVAMWMESNAFPCAPEWGQSPPGIE